MDEMIMKTCSKCDATLPLDKFVKNSRQKDGRGSHCKECYNKYYGHSHRQQQLSKKPIIKDAPKVENSVVKEYEKYNLDNIPPRLLIAQLRKLGYRGELELVTISKVVI